MQLTHARDHGLAGLFVRANPERGVFFRERCECLGQLVLVALAPGLNGNVHNWLRERQLLKDNRVRRVTQGIPCAGVLETNAGDDIACTRVVTVFAIVGVHLQDAANALLVARSGIEHLVALVERTGVDPEVHELAHVWVGHDLERQGRERRVVVGQALEFALALEICATGGRQIKRGGKVRSYRVEEGLHALVLECGASEDGDDLVGNGATTKRIVELFLGDFFAFEVRHHDVFVDIGKCFEQLGSVLGRDLDHVGWDFVEFVVGAHLDFATPDNSLHTNQVDDAFKGGL